MGATATLPGRSTRGPVWARKLARQIGWSRILLAFALLVLALLIARYSWRVPMMIDAEHALYDMRVALTAPVVGQDPRILIVPYTDETLIATGKRSPLDRTVLARALRRIDGMGAKAIGIDVLVDQPQADDPVLIAALRNMRTPTFLAHASTESASEKILFRQQAFLDEFQRAIATGTTRAASIVLQTDADNVLRRWPALVPGAPPRLPNALLPQAREFRTYEGSIAYRRSAKTGVPLFNAVPIDTFATDELFAVPEAAALFAEQVRGRYVLIGGNIEDIDLFLTPLSRIAAKGESRTTWGMDLFAVMLAQMLDGRPLAPIPPMTGWIVAALVLAAATGSALGTRRPATAGLLLATQFALMAGVPFWLAAGGIDTYGLPAFGWLAGWLLTYLVVTAIGRALSSEQRKFAQGALGRYLPREIANEIMKDPDSLQLRGEKREIFVLFSDLEGFTKLSHAIEPEMVAFLLNRYLDLLSDIVLDHGGTIDKFVGDAVVAFWGAPIARPDDGRRAVEAAIAMNRAGERFRREAPEGVPPIGMTRVGVHFGEAIVGNFGGEGRIQYTALGDAMNTAARLEAANKQTKTGVLVSEAAVARSGLDFFRPLGRVVLRGRASPIAIFEPVPDMLVDTRYRHKALIEKAMANDPAARADLSALSEAEPADTALAGLVRRFAEQKGEDHYVLD
jgi:adenylate cyclase